MKTATVDYYNNNAKSWADSHNTSKFWGEHFDRFKELLPDGSIIDIGCGAGRDAEYLISLGYEYVGLDPSEKFIEIARDRNPTGEFACSYIQEFTTQKKFDGLWASASLLHIPKDELDKVLMKINSLLKNKAVGFISIKKDLNMILKEDQDERLFSFWKAEEFEKALNKSGFELIDSVKELPMSAKTVWLIFFVKKVNSV